MSLFFFSQGEAFCRPDRPPAKHGADCQLRAETRAGCQNNNDPLRAWPPEWWVFWGWRKQGIDLFTGKIISFDASEACQGSQSFLCAWGNTAVGKAAEDCRRPKWPRGANYGQRPFRRCWCDGIRWFPDKAVSPEWLEKKCFESARENRTMPKPVIIWDGLKLRGTHPYSYAAALRLEGLVVTLTSISPMTGAFIKARSALATSLSGRVREFATTLWPLAVSVF